MSDLWTQDIYGVYEGSETPTIENYPVLLPNILSPDDLDPFKHSSIDPARDIRLLELLPPQRERTHNQELLKCRLTTHALAEIPKYEALSYTWGKIKGHLPVSILSTTELGVVKEEALFATPQLMMALRRLRHPTSSRFLWIDQLCIDQGNKTEKGPQIQLMGDIYKRAEKVVIWLGEDNYLWDFNHGAKKLQRSQILADTLNLLLANQNASQEDSVLAHELVDVQITYHVDSIGQQRLDTIIDFLSRPWFTRAWVFQEASLAKRLQMQYGELGFSFEDLKRLFDAVYQVEKTSGIHRRRSLALNTPGFEMMHLIQRTRDEMNSRIIGEASELRGTPFLWKLLQVLRRVQCYDQKDLIYAFIAFQNGEGITASADSYKQSVEELWIHAAECIIKSSESLEIFAAISGDKPREKKLPSWVPYWSDCLPFSRPIATLFTNFCAARDTRHVWDPHPNSTKLRVKGKIIDEIFQGPRAITMPCGKFMSFKHPTAMFIPLDLIEQWARNWYISEDGVSKEFGEHLPTKLQTLRRDLFRTLLADGALGTQQPLRGVIDDMMDVHTKSDSIFHMRDAKNRDKMSPEESFLLDEYEKLENLALVAELKQLFFTKHFQLGMASHGVQVGDKIAIIHGSKVPCVLRTVDEGKKEYQVKSQCYLDGWMFGKPRAEIPRPHPHRNWFEEIPDSFVLV